MYLCQSEPAFTAELKNSTWSDKKRMFFTIQCSAKILTLVVNLLFNCLDINTGHRKHVCFKL